MSTEKTNRTLCSNCGDLYVDDVKQCCMAPSPKRGLTIEDALELLRLVGLRQAEPLANSRAA